MPLVLGAHVDSKASFATAGSIRTGKTGASLDDRDDGGSKDGDAGAGAGHGRPPVDRGPMCIVAYHLPVLLSKRSDAGPGENPWTAEWNLDNLCARSENFSSILFGI